MDETAARFRLERMLAAADPPALDDNEIADLLDIARLTDKVGRTPDDPNWTPTWNLARAASEGWYWKAGKVAGGYDFQSEAQSFSRSQIHAHCLAMGEKFEKGDFVSVPLGTAYVYGRRWYGDAINNIGVE